MPARVLVFLRRSVAGVTVKDLQDELGDADLWTLAEALNLPEGEEAAVKAMKKVLRFESDDPSDIDGLEIHWHAKQRPIQLRRAPPIDGELDETLELLAGKGGKNADRVRKVLRETKEVVEFEMGVDGSLHLAATISEVLGFFLAERGDGLVFFYHRDFAAPDDRGTNLVTVT
ncbi:MAG: hypothetical protein U0228_34365 [Myxococcaceae bacterium]